MIRPIFRLISFLLIFLVFIVFANAFLIRTDLFTRAMMYEMHSRSDIDLAFIGSSVCRNHINANLISEKIGQVVFNASVPDLAMQGSIALTRELFLNHSPDAVILVVDAYTFDSDLEAAEAEYMLMPWLSDRKNQFEYYKNLTESDGWYLDRLLMFRDFGAERLSDIIKTTSLHLFPESALHIYGNTAKDGEAEVLYEGSGFLRYQTEKRADNDIRARMQRIYTGWDYRLYPRSKDMLLAYRDLVAEQGSRLLVLISPSHTVHQLADPSYYGYTLRLMQFCRKNGIECVNFGWAKPELLPNLDAYYYDLFHLSGEGADLYSEALAVYLKGWIERKDVSDLFYGSQAEYLENIDFITNVWIEKLDRKEKWNRAREQEKNAVLALPENVDIYLANCNHGPSVVPEYRFVFRTEDGKEQPLTDWKTDGIYCLDDQMQASGILRVYARPAGKENDLVWYDFTG